MIYSAKVLEIHTNICSVEANTEAEARQKFLSETISGDDCLGSEYVSTVAFIQIKENPNHDADFDSLDPKECMKLLNAKALERVNALLESLDFNEFKAYNFLVENNWYGLRGFIAGLRDELEGTVE